MFIRNNVIITAGIYHEELSVLTQENCFLLAFNGMLFNVKSRAKFYRSVGPVFWCLYIGQPSNLPDMTGGPTVFGEDDRSGKQIKFHLKSYLIQDRKTGIN